MVALAFVAALTRPPVSPAARAAAPQVWVVTSGTASMVGVHAPKIAHRLFGSQRSVVLGIATPGSGSPSALSWASEAAFEDAVRNVWIPHTVRTVMYDPENWPSTPERERVDPVAAMRAFALMARAHGYRVILTPHPSLMTVAGGKCTVRPGEAIEAAYVRCDIAGQAARYADIVETQAQYLETDPGAYGDFVSSTAAQARAANPDVLVISGLSTNFVDSPAALYQAWFAVRDVTDGHYLAVPGGRRYAVAIGFLRLLPR